MQYLKEKKEDWPRSEEEARDRNRETERKSWTRNVAGMESQLLTDSIERGTLEHPDFKIHWYRINPERSNIPYFIQNGFVASLYENEIYDLHRHRSASSYMSMFGIYRRQVQQNLVLIVEPNPTHLMTDNSRSRLIDARIYERHTTEKLPWAVYGEFFKENMPASIRQELENISIGATNEELTKAIDAEIKKYAPWMSRANRIRSSLQQTPDTPEIEKLKQAKENDKKDKDEEEKENKPKKPKPRKPRDGCRIRNGLVDTPQIQWLPEAEDEDIKGQIGRYDIVSNILFMNTDFSLFKEESLRRLQEYDLSGDETAEQALIAATRRTYAEKVATSIVHLHKFKDTEHWTTEKWEAVVSPHSLTFNVLGMKWAESGIRQFSGPEFSAKKKTVEETKKAKNAATRRGKKAAAAFAGSIIGKKICKRPTKKA